MRHMARIRARPTMILYVSEFNVYAPPMKAIGIDPIINGMNRRQLKCPARDRRLNTSMVTKIFIISTAGFIKAGSRPNNAMTAR